MTRAILITVDVATLVLVLATVLWAGMRALLPLLEGGAPRVRNYRGADVPMGLGLVWLFAVIGVGLHALVADGVTDLMFGVFDLGVDGTSGVVPLFSRSPDVFLRATEAVLAVVLVGLVDDLFGDDDAKGLRGHLKEALRGRPTTGALKAVGIGVLAAVATWRIAPALWVGTGSVFRPSHLLGWLAATVLVAGSANLVNLTDLRPGRALKTYALFVAVAVAGLVATGSQWTGVAPIERLTAGAVVAILALLPLTAVWKADLSERAMLGDAGANSFGFVAGVLLVLSYPAWGVVALAVVVAVLNLISERVSFSAVIDRTAPLRWLDGLGRLEWPPSDESPDIPDER